MDVVMEVMSGSGRLPEKTVVSKERASVGGWRIGVSSRNLHAVRRPESCSSV